MISGSHYSEEARRKLSEACRGRVGALNPNFGKHPSEETRRKMGDGNRGRVGALAPMFGKHHSEDSRRKMSEGKRGHPVSEETRRKMSEAKRGIRPSGACRRAACEANWGLHHSEDRCRKNSEAHFGLHPSDETRRKMSEANRRRPPVSEETCRKISERQRGARSHLWKGGISFEPYCPRFNRLFKRRVRAFFGNRCVECGTPENGRALDVHHVNFEKMSCCDGTPPLFVPLCPSCHRKTQSNRPFWEQHFTEMIEGYYGGKCYFTEAEMVLVCGSVGRGR